MEVAAGHKLRTSARAWTVFVICVVGLGGGARAAQEPLPEPLTLDHALSLATQQHPDLLRAQAEIERAHAERLLAKSETGLQSYVRGRLRWVEPNSTFRDFDNHDDNAIGIFASKRLYDFGKTRALLAAADANVKSRELLYRDTMNARRVAIMDAYFEVLLADLQFARDNEAMATEFVALDRLRDRRELGQVSDLEVLQQESLYQRSRRQRFASEARQRLTRAQLANLLNRPGDLPSTLVKPALPLLDREIPAVDALQQEAVEQSPLLVALREKVAGARERVEAARARDNPVVTGEVEAAAWARDLRANDNFRIGVVLEIPLTQGGKTDAAVAEHLAALHEAEAELAATELQVRQGVLETWIELDTLRIQREEARVQSEFRELDLDRSRSLYELEVKTDLGDSMVRYTEAELLTTETEFRLALAWARLDALLGRVVSAAPATVAVPAERGDLQPVATGE